MPDACVENRHLHDKGLSSRRALSSTRRSLADYRVRFTYCREKVNLPRSFGGLSYFDLRVIRSNWALYGAYVNLHAARPLGQILGAVSAVGSPAIKY